MTAPKFITYKDIMAVYGLTVPSAKHKLTVIRAVLGKKRRQNVLVAEFCSAENVDQTLFEKQLHLETTAIYQPKRYEQAAINFK